MNTEAQLAIIAQTTLLEAESEPYEGKLAVAYTIVNRMAKRTQTAAQVCWAPWQYSCWLDPLDKIAVRMNRASERSWFDSQHAAEVAWNKRTPDPTHGATLYLNKSLTIQTRSDHKLPSWVDESKHTVKIGLHDFYTE